jgi:hypothetical protein
MSDLDFTVTSRSAVIKVDKPETCKWISSTSNSTVTVFHHFAYRPQHYFPENSMQNIVFKTIYLITAWCTSTQTFFILMDARGITHLTLFSWWKHEAVRLNTAPLIAACEMSPYHPFIDDRMQRLRKCSGAYLMLPVVNGKFLMRIWDFMTSKMYNVLSLGPQFGPRFSFRYSAFNDRGKLAAAWSGRNISHRLRL